MHHQVRYLLGIARSDDDASRRRTALKGLASIGRRAGRDSDDHRVIRETLIAGLRDDQPGRRLESVRNLRRLADETIADALATVAADDEAPIRAAAIQTLVDLGDPLPALTSVEVLLQTEPDGAVRHRGLVAIKERVTRDPEAREWALALGHGWLEDRYHAQHLGLDLLRLLDVPGDADRCLRFLRHPELVVRWTALAGLRRYPEHDQISLRRLDDDSVYLRRQATLTLAVRGRAEAFERLAELIDDEDEWIQYYAAYGLIGIGGERVLALLRRALHSPHPRVRAEAAQGLRHHARRDDLDRAVELLYDADAGVRNAAIQLILRILHEHDLEPLPPSSPVLAGYVHLLAEPGSAAAFNAAHHLLIEHRRRPTFHDAEAADPILVESLTAALDRYDPSDWGVMECSGAVVRLLGVLGDRSAVPAIMRWLDRPQIAGGFHFRDVAAYARERLSFEHPGLDAILSLEGEELTRWVHRPPGPRTS